MEKFEFKKDKYSQARGGNSLFLEIFCANCNAKILVYQKDGPGNLLRMYCDRILLPHGLVELLLTKKRKQDITNLICKGCGKIIAPCTTRYANRDSRSYIIGNAKIFPHPLQIRFVIS